jgi:hypothetical protein
MVGFFVRFANRQDFGHVVTAPAAIGFRAFLDATLIPIGRAAYYEPAVVALATDVFD